MKKKILMVCLLAMMASGTAFSSSKDKLGAYIGWPLGLSYSHEFTDLVGLDLVAAYSGWGPGIGGLNVYLGALFTLVDGSVDGNPWALTLGPSVGGTIGLWGDIWGSLDILADLRWEIDIREVKGFNIFIDFAPGVAVLFNHEHPVWFTSRGGVGLRYRFQ